MKTDVLSRLMEFCHQQKQIYLYGAGLYAERYRDILESFGWAIAGCIVSKKSSENLFRKNVWSVDEIQTELSVNTGVILALSERNHDEVRSLLKTRAAYSGKVFALYDAELSLLYDEHVLLPMAHQNAVPCRSELPALSDLHKILVIRLDVLGDMLMTIPFLRELHRNAPQAEIDVVLRRSNQFLLEDCPYIHRAIPYDTDPLDHVDVEKIKDFIKEQGLDSGYQALFLPCVLLAGRSYVETYAMAMMTGISCRIARLTSFDSTSMDSSREKQRLEDVRPFFTKVVWQKKPRHEVQYMLELVEACGGTVVDDKMEYWIGELDRAFAKRILAGCKGAEQNRFLAIGLVSRAKNRTWDAVNFLKLYAELRQKNKSIFFVLLGGKDACEAASVFRHCHHVLDLTGRTTLPQVAALIAECELYVGANTGLLHFATALRKPVVEISAWLPDGSPTDGISPMRMGAWGVPQVLCQPEKGLDGCRGSCEKTYAHCIDTVKVEDVAQGVWKLMPNL